MTKLEFDVLYMLGEKAPFDIPYLSRTLYKEDSVIARACKKLIDYGYIWENGDLTEAGAEELEHHRVDNAVILAAGMSTRFVPLNFEKPKGLLTVKGEVLIERQIRQLREIGIDEIIIVVGHMKEHFSYLSQRYGVILVETDAYEKRNNHASVYAARKYLKNTIITSADLYFSQNIFQRYAYDSYYSAVYISGKTAERGIETDARDRILKTMYGDQCYDIWVTLGYAFFSQRFSDNFLTIMEREYDLPETADKFWADIQDAHLDELYMYAKRCDSGIIYEFDSLEELREFDCEYVYHSGSKILDQICKQLAVEENNIIEIKSLKEIRPSLFRFRCKGNIYICDIDPNEREKIWHRGRLFYKCNDSYSGIRLYKMEKGIFLKERVSTDMTENLSGLYEITERFKEYHNRALPLCAAENVVSPFANLPLGFGFQERYIMNNTYSFHMDDNFIGCEKLFPYYQMISESCERIFGAKYTDPRPFSGMHCLDMVTKTICRPGDKMMILGKEHGGHASVKPVVERLGIEVIIAPYDLEKNDLDYEKANEMIAAEGISYVLLAPSDLIRPMHVEHIDTSRCVLLWDASQLLGLIAAGLCTNPIRTMKNVVMFGGTHKTFPGPASGLIMTNEAHLHDKMERNINPKYLRNSQMHQKVCLLFALLEFEQYGAEYMSHMLHCSNYLGQKIRDYGFDVADINGEISSTHQIFIRCSKEEMDIIYENAYHCEVTLNKKHKELFLGYGIRIGTQEIARYDWNDEVLDQVAYIISRLAIPNVDTEEIKRLIASLPEKKIHYTFSDGIVDRFKNLMI